MKNEILNICLLGLDAIIIFISFKRLYVRKKIYTLKFNKVKCKNTAAK